MKRTKKARKTRKPPKRHRRKRKRAKKRSARRWRTKKKTPKMRRTRRKTAGRPNARRRMKAKKKTPKRAGADWNARNPTVRAHSRRTFWLRAEKRAANAYPLNRSKDDNVNDGRQSPTARHLER